MNVPPVATLSACSSECVTQIQLCFLPSSSPSKIVFSTNIVACESSADVGSTPFPHQYNIQRGKDRGGQTIKE